MSNPLIKFKKIVIGTSAAWKCESVAPPEWDVFDEAGEDIMGRLLYPGCRVFTAVNNVTGETMDRRCRLPDHSSGVATTTTTAAPGGTTTTTTTAFPNGNYLEDALRFTVTDHAGNSEAVTGIEIRFDGVHVVNGEVIAGTFTMDEVKQGWLEVFWTTATRSGLGLSKFGLSLQLSTQLSDPEIIARAGDFQIKVRDNGGFEIT